MTPPAHANAVYKIMTADEFGQLQRVGVFHGAPIDLADGYIHLSSASQLAETLDKHFAGHVGLVIAAVDIASASGSVRWEPSRGGQLFPHLYGPLTTAAILAFGGVERSLDGTLSLPG